VQLLEARTSVFFRRLPLHLTAAIAITAEGMYGTACGQAENGQCDKNGASISFHDNLLVGRVMWSGASSGISSFHGTHLNASMYLRCVAAPLDR
jgi:hypothetical protein